MEIKMKLRSLLLGVTTMALLSGQALADNTDDADVTVTGEVVTPISISVAGNMDLPGIVLPSTGSATLTIDTAGVGTYSSGADPTPGASDNTITPPLATVTGADATYTILASSATGLPTGITFDPNCGTTGTISGGPSTFSCGGLLTVPSSASTGTFNAGTFNLTVTYQ